MSNIEIFNNNEFGEIRTIEHNNDIWFVAKDVSEALGYTWSGTRISHVPEEWRGMTSVVTPSGIQRTQYLTEQGLYFFLARSDKEKALPFQKWIAGDVLPSIRKHGGYLTPQKIEEALLDPDTIIQLATQLKNERAEKQQLVLDNKVKDQLISELKPKADYTDKILQSKGLTPISIISKDYGMSATAFNKLLHEKGIQYRQAETWLLYAKYQDKGYTHSKTFDYRDSKDNPQTRLNTQWTQKGRLFLYNILKDNDILPVIERDTEKIA